MTSELFPTTKATKVKGAGWISLGNGLKRSSCLPALGLDTISGIMTILLDLVVV